MFQGLGPVRQALEVAWAPGLEVHKPQQPGLGLQDPDFEEALALESRVLANPWQWRLPDLLQPQAPLLPKQQDPESEFLQT